MTREKNRLFPAFCDECGEKIHRWVYIVDGKTICNTCVKKNHRKKATEAGLDTTEYNLGGE